MASRKQNPFPDESTPATDGIETATDEVFADATDVIDVADGDVAGSTQGQLDDNVAELTDRNLRLHAEMENLRQRTAREITEQHRYAALPLIRDLLDVVDNVDRAIEAGVASSESESLLEGFRLVAQQLQTTLQKHHCLAIDAVGQPFDPNRHEAISQMPSEEYPAGTVSLATQVGYLLHDRVARPSQVIVSTGPAEG